MWELFIVIFVIKVLLTIVFFDVAALFLATQFTKVLKLFKRGEL